jgi:hypothetical protein
MYWWDEDRAEAAATTTMTTTTTTTCGADAGCDCDVEQRQYERGPCAKRLQTSKDAYIDEQYRRESFKKVLLSEAGGGNAAYSIRHQ